MQPYLAKHTMKATIAMTNAQMAPWVAQINAPTITAAMMNHTSKAPKNCMPATIAGCAGRIKP